MIPQSNFGRSVLRRRFFVGLIAALGFGLSASAAPRWRGPIAQSLMRGFAAEPVAAGALRPSERTFLEKAASMSRDKLRLARLAVGQATGSEVREFAQQLATDHQSITNTIADLQRRKGVASQPAPNTPATPEIVSEAYQRVAQKTGAEFDREFVRVVADAHTEFMTLFEQAIGDAKDADVRDFAGAILPTLREHQNRLTELRKVLD